MVATGARSIGARRRFWLPDQCAPAIRRSLAMPKSASNGRNRPRSRPRAQRSSSRTGERERVILVGPVHPDGANAVGVRSRSHARSSALSDLYSTATGSARSITVVVSRCRVGEMGGKEARDRTAALSPQPYHRGCAGMGAARVSGSTREIRRSAAPVSYTHLRAHET